MKKLISIILSALILMSIVSVNITFKAVAEENTIGNTGLTYYVDAENGNYNIRDIEKIRERIPDFQSIPLEKIGRVAE